jgi:hypothetical protein
MVSRVEKRRSGSMLSGRLDGIRTLQLMGIDANLFKDCFLPITVGYLFSVLLALWTI